LQLAFLYRALLIAVAPVVALAGEPNRSWDVLMQSLESGKSVVVTRMTSAKVEGKLLGITPDAITVHWHGQPQVIQRDDVYRVRFANIRRGHTLGGMAIGVVAGAIIGAVGAGQGWRAEGAAGFGALGLGIGAGVGGALPIGEPLYQVAGKPTRPVSGGAGPK
jgi:hypothetical protein